jgi:hypothetical protein
MGILYNIPLPKKKRAEEIAFVFVRLAIRDVIEPSRVEFEDFKTGSFMSRA